MKLTVKNTSYVYDMIHRSSSMGSALLPHSIPSSDAKRGTSDCNPPATADGTTSTDVTHEKWPEPAITASAVTRWQKRGLQRAPNQRHRYAREQPLNFKWLKGQRLHSITVQYIYTVHMDVCHLVPADMYFLEIAVHSVKDTNAKAAKWKI